MRVKVSFQLVRDDTGQVLDTTETTGPLSFVCGRKEVVAGMDAGVRGMLVGETKAISLTGTDGWGERDKAKIGEIPVSSLPSGVRVGTKLQLQGPDGPMQALVQEMNDTTALLDFNHPLAGLPLTMTVTVVGCEKEDASAAGGRWVAQGQAVRPRQERLEKFETEPGIGPCAICCKPARLRCSACKQVLYCSPACAERHWTSLGHQETCGLDTCGLDRRDFQLDRVPPAEPPGSADLSALSPEVFQAAHCEGEGRPVVIRNALRPSHLGAMWTLDSMVRQLGRDTKVQVRFYRGVAQSPERWTHVGYCDSTLTSVGSFAQLVRSGAAARDDAYVNCDLVGTPAEASALAQMVRDDLARIGEVTGLRPTATLGEQLNIWWGAPGHTEPLHSDTSDGTLLQIRGRKRVVLFPASEWLNLYPFPMQAKMSWAWSRISLQDVDVGSYPNVRKALGRRSEVTLHEGDALFIPAGWAHQITGLEDAAGPSADSPHVLSVNRFWKTSVERASRWLPEDVGSVFRQTFPNGM